MKHVILAIVVSLTTAFTSAQVQQSGGQEQQSTNQGQQRQQVFEPVPEKILPGIGLMPPADAIILFDGTDLSKWESSDGESAKWNVKNGTMVVEPGTGSLVTKDSFGDCQLHIEFKSPPPEEYNGQDRGNSGVFLQSRYEVQVLDGEDNPTYVNGMVGSIYLQSIPLVNAYTSNGEWQVYDIYWKAPIFGADGHVESPPMVTVVLNGMVVQNNFVLKIDSSSSRFSPHGPMPLSLQDHGTKVAFRNIWIRNL